MQTDMTMCAVATVNRQRVLPFGSTQQQLRVLYIVASFLSLFMAFWILVIPSTFLVGRWELHDRLLYNSQGFRSEDYIASPELSFKYKGHTAVHLTHLLPGAVWALAIPFQLHRRFRKDHPRLHRRIGYAYMVSSMLLMIGVVIIVQRGLLFENFFPDLPPNKNVMSTYIGLAGLTLWHLYTAIAALVYAQRRRFVLHQAYVIRNVASGVWVALQRIILVMILPIFLWPPISRQVQREAFGRASQVASVVCIVAGEYTIHLLRIEQAEQTKRKDTKSVQQKTRSKQE